MTDHSFTLAASKEQFIQVVFLCRNCSVFADALSRCRTMLSKRILGLTALKWMLSLGVNPQIDFVKYRPIPLHRLMFSMILDLEAVWVNIKTLVWNIWTQFISFSSRPSEMCFLN